MYNIKNHVSFSYNEILKIVLTSIIISLIMSLTLNNSTILIIYFGFFLIMITLKVFFQKSIASNNGCYAYYDINKYSLFLTSTFAFSILKFFNTGSIVIDSIKYQRIGEEFEHPTNKLLGLTAISGIIPWLILLFIFTKLSILGNLNVEINKLIVMMIIYSLIPIPSFDGFLLMYGSRIWYTIITSITLLTIILINISNSIILSILSGIMIGIIITLLYYYNVELNL